MEFEAWGHDPEPAPSGRLAVDGGAEDKGDGGYDDDNTKQEQPDEDGHASCILGSGLGDPEGVDEDVGQPEKGFHWSGESFFRSDHSSVALPNAWQRGGRMDPEAMRPQPFLRIYSGERT